VNLERRATMKSLEKLLTIKKNGQFQKIQIAINVLKPKDGKMELVTSNKITTGSLEIKDFKFFLKIPKLEYESYVCVEYVDFDMLELIDVSKLPRKLLVFDIELPVPF